MSNELERAKEEILEAIKKQSRSSKTWDAGIVFFEIVLAAVIGWIVWSAQSDVTRKIGIESQQLSTQLSLSQEYYEQRLECYLELHREIRRVEDALRTWERALGAQFAGVALSLGALHRLYTDNSLFLSAELEQQLKEAWTATKSLRNKSPADATSAEITTPAVLLATAKKTMRRDLAIDRLAEGAVLDRPAR